MMTPAQRVKALKDRSAKLAARRLPMPTGGEGRRLEEALGTGAAARGLAMMNTKKPEGADKPLRGLARIRRSM